MAAAPEEASERPTPPEILKWMKDLNDWFSVGEKLSIRYMKLHALEDKYPADPEKAREELVDLWFEKDKNPTWARLADAFEYAGQRAIGKRIRETYNCPKRPREPRSVMERYQRKPVQPQPPPRPVISYPKPPPSPPPPSPPYRMPRRSFHCSCEKFTPFIVIHANRKGRNKYKYLSYIPPASCGVERELQFKRESDEMVARLSSVIIRLIRSFKSESVSASDVAKCLLEFKSFLSPREHVPFFQHRADEINSMTTVDDLILLASDYISITNRALLDFLVGNLGCEEDGDELESFIAYSTMFCKRSVFETPPYIYGYIRLRSEALVVLRTDERYVRSNIYGIGVFVGQLSQVFKIEQYCLHFCRIDYLHNDKGEKSIEMVLRMPSHLLKEVFPLNQEAESGLVPIGVTQIHTINYCYNPTNASEPPHPVHKPGKKHRRVSGNRMLEKGLSSGLKPCCRYHSRMRQLRCQSCELVTTEDPGYEGDGYSSTEELRSLEPIPLIAIRPTYQKRLMWRLANTGF